MKGRAAQLAILLCAAAVIAAPMLLRSARAAQSSDSVLARPAAPRPRLDFLGEWGTRGDGPANLDLAVAIAADARGAVYIADAGSGFLHKFTADGHPLLAFDDPRVTNPVAIAVDSDGEIYAADGRSGPRAARRRAGALPRALRARRGCGCKSVRGRLGAGRRGRIRRPGTHGAGGCARLGRNLPRAR